MEVTLAGFEIQSVSMLLCQSECCRILKLTALQCAELSLHHQAEKWEPVFFYAQLFFTT